MSGWKPDLRECQAGSLTYVNVRLESLTYVNVRLESLTYVNVRLEA
jgi:hypothetical protein